MLPAFPYPKLVRLTAAGYRSKLFILGIDLAFSLCSYLAALLISTKFDLGRTVGMIGWATAILLLLRGWSFLYFRTYLFIVRYVGEKDYKNIFYAITSASLVFVSWLYVFPGFLPPEEILSVVVIDFLILFTLACGFRILLRLVFDRLRMRQRSRINTAVFGAGELGAMLMRILRHNDSHNYRVAAFFDDDQKLVAKGLNGVPIFDPNRSFESVIKKYDIKVAIIAINDLTDTRRVEFINRCLEHHVKVLKVPGTESWIHNQLGVGQLRAIRVEDLLNRPPIQLNTTCINASLRDRCVLVTGCAGSIGEEIVGQLLKFSSRQIIGVDKAETPMAAMMLRLKDKIEEGRFLPIIGDVRDYHRLDALFAAHQPNYVFHAAAYKHVPIMEQFPGEAIKANVLGTKNLADLAAAYKVEKFVMISTDKAVNPSNVMGASKRIAEIYVQALNFQASNQTRFITTRFGNVLGSNGSVIPIFREQIQRREAVTVTHPEVTRFFMTIPEACQLVLEAAAMGKGGEIFLFDMGDPVKIVDLARRMIQMAGLVPGHDIKIKFIGLRPGEKLYEELLDRGESNKATHHPKIKIAAVRPGENVERFEGTLLDLIHAAERGAPKEIIVSLMKELVPEYVSRNSEFEKVKRATH